MNAQFDSYVRDAQTGRGAHVTHADLLALLEFASREQFIVRTVHAYDDASTLCRSDASFHVPHSQDLTDWSENVRRSVSFALQQLNSVTDKTELRYEVWFDGSGRAKQEDQAT
jgi:hypothetical protein